MLAKLLEEQRQPTQITGGYGELAARLLGQGITQWSANKAEKAVADERSQRFEGQLGSANAVLADILARSGRGEMPAVDTAMPMSAPMPEPSATAPTAAVAPVGQVMGSPMPPAAPAGSPPVPMPPADVPPVMPVPIAPAPTPMPMADATPAPAPVAPMAAPAAPRSAPNALGITPGEQARIERIVRIAQETGDPALLAYAQNELDAIDQRMNAAPEWKDVSVNGVPYLRDQFGNMREAFPDGIPQSAMAQNATVGEDNPYGVAGGTGISLDPFNRPQIVGRPPEGFSREPGGGLSAERGGPQDLNSPTRRFAELTNLRKEIDPIIDSATLLQRNVQALRAGARAQNGAGDIAMINGLQKLIDEGVVREGDVALQLQAQGINGGIAGLQGYLTSSGRFSPAIRSQLLATGEDIYRNMNAVYRDRVLSYEPLVTSSFGAGAFDDVLPSRTRDAFGWGGASAPQSPRQQPRNPRPAAPNRPRQARPNVPPPPPGFEID